MRFPGFLLLVSAVSVLGAIPSADQAGSLRPDPPMVCASCDAWNVPRTPFRIFGNTYFVGTAGLGAILVTSNEGHLLLDGGLTQTASLVDASIRSLGFRTEDVKLIVNSHAHYDHAGGIAALQRVSRATVAASVAGARAIERGEPTEDDPQFAFGKAANAFPAVANVRRVNDKETLRAGSVAVTAHLTPGHTPGSTSWTWRACEGNQCLDVVYADSLNAVSAPAFKFSAAPDLVARFRRSMAVVGALPCDILLTVHPNLADLDGKFARMKAQAGANPFVDRNGCRTYAGDALKRLEQRLASEK